MTGCGAAWSSTGKQPGGGDRCLQTWGAASGLFLRGQTWFGLNPALQESFPSNTAPHGSPSTTRHSPEAWGGSLDPWEPWWSTWLPTWPARGPVMTHKQLGQSLLNAASAWFKELESELALEKLLLYWWTNHSPHKTLDKYYRALTYPKTSRLVYVGFSELICLSQI